MIKGPIPAEHLQLQEAFDGLVAKCRGTAMNQVRDYRGVGTSGHRGTCLAGF